MFKVGYLIKSGYTYIITDIQEPYYDVHEGQVGEHGGNIGSFFVSQSMFDKNHFLTDIFV